MIQGGNRDLASMCPVLAPNLRLHLNPHRSYLIEAEQDDRRMDDGARVTVPSQVRATLNRDGAELLLRCTGEHPLEEIVDDLKKRDRSYSASKARLFLEEAVAHRHVTFAATARPGADDRHTGYLDRYVPSHVSIEVTDQCNLNCDFCYHATGGRVERTIDFSRLRDRLTEWKALGLLVVELTGGEATTVPYFWDLLGFCADRFPLTGVLTNGTNLGAEVIARIPKGPGMVSFSVSLDASTPGRFMRITGGSEEQFGQVVGGISRLVSSGHWVNVSMTVTEDAIDDMLPTARLVHSLGARRFACSTTLPFGRGRSEGWRWSEQAFARFYENVREIGNEMPGFLSNIREAEEDPSTGDPSDGEICGMGKSAAVLSPSGRVRGCLLIPRSWSVGSIQDASPREIFEGDAYQSLARVPFPSPQLCEGDCRYTMFCRGCLVRPVAACEREGRPCVYLERSGLIDWMDRWGPGLGSLGGSPISPGRGKPEGAIPRIACPHHE